MKSEKIFLSSLLLLSVAIPLIFFLLLSKHTAYFRTYFAEFIPLPSKWVQYIWVPSNYLDKQDEKSKKIQEWFDDHDINKNHSSEEVTTKIANLVYSDLDPARGIPESYTDTFSMWQNAKSGKQHVWCTQFAELYALLSNHAGIPTRVIHIRNKKNLSDSYYWHTVAESYFKEEKRWVLVDLTYGQQYAYSDNSGKLNTIQYVKSRTEKNPQIKIQLVSEIDESENEDLVNDQSKYFHQNTLLLFESLNPQNGLGNPITL